MDSTTTLLVIVVGLQVLLGFYLVIWLRKNERRLRGGDDEMKAKLDEVLRRTNLHAPLPPSLLISDEDRAAALERLRKYKSPGS